LLMGSSIDSNVGRPHPQFCCRREEGRERSRLACEIIDKETPAKGGWTMQEGE
jgi:hypothetical protein